MTVDLSSKVAIVTGAGRGLGEAIARALATAGASVAVNDLNPDRAERVAAAIRADGGEALGVVADISNKYQCVSLVEATREAWGRLDILVNNAAVRPRGPIVKMDEWDWTRVIDVNLKGVFFMSQLVGRVMADENGARGGVIVNIGDGLGLAGAEPDRAAYIASKAGLAGFTRACAIEYAAFGVRVNMIVPGQLATPASERERSDPVVPDQWQSQIPLDRLGAPEEAAEAVVFLCSDAAAHITGSVLAADGGYSLGG
jgi:NAD(P)-dependent dehydrogenase (short-subunit alcohol dehydrogenase family)